MIAQQSYDRSGAREKVTKGNFISLFFAFECTMTMHLRTSAHTHTHTHTHIHTHIYTFSLSLSCAASMLLSQCFTYKLIVKFVETLLAPYHILRKIEYFRHTLAAPCVRRSLLWPFYISLSSQYI